MRLEIAFARGSRGGLAVRGEGKARGEKTDRGEGGREFEKEEDGFRGASGLVEGKACEDKADAGISEVTNGEVEVEEEVCEAEGVV